MTEMLVEDPSPLVGEGARRADEGWAYAGPAAFSTARNSAP
jgi:hypothetical protein